MRLEKSLSLKKKESPPQQKRRHCYKIWKRFSILVCYNLRRVRIKSKAQTLLLANLLLEFGFFSSITAFQCSKTIVKTYCICQTTLLFVFYSTIKLVSITNENIVRKYMIFFCFQLRHNDLTISVINWLGIVRSTYITYKIFWSYPKSFRIYGRK